MTCAILGLLALCACFWVYALAKLARAAPALPRGLLRTFFDFPLSFSSDSDLDRFFRFRPGTVAGEGSRARSTGEGSRELLVKGTGGIGGLSPSKR